MRRARPFLLTALGAAALAVSGCGGEEQSSRDAAVDPLGPASTSPREGSGAEESTPAQGSAPPARGKVKEIATGLEVPWDIGFLPGGDALVTERDRGRVVRIPAGGGTPQPFLESVDGVEPGGEGGLLGVAVSPDYEDDKTVFLYFTAADDNRVVAYDMTDPEQPEADPILTGLKKGQIHNGGALEFGPDGKLYVGVGETGEPGLAQDRSSTSGKILRIDADGGIPAGNPIDGSPVWSLGHRNVQGISWDSDDRMWASEFGQNEVDEVNLIRKGGNYGWPEVEGEGDGGANPDFITPVVAWTPTSSSSPSGAAVAGNELYVSALAGRTLWQIELDGTAIEGDPKSLFPDRYGRIRGVATAPDGSVWFSTSNTDGRGEPKDGDDRILQLGT